MPDGAITLDTVLDSVTRRYPPFLRALLQRDLASGRLRQALGAFDTGLKAKVEDRLLGYYEATVAQGMLEQPLATGDTVYGGYRWSDGTLPDYYTDRTQEAGELVLGARLPLLRGRATDGRRAAVRKAQIDIVLAEPDIAQARIGFVRAASLAFFTWEAAGRKLSIARQLLRLAEDRQAGLQRAVERQFLAPIALTDNERLIAQRRVFEARAQRAFQSASLALSLYLRGDDDRPVVPGEPNLPAPTPPPSDLASEAEHDVALAMRRRPEPRQLQLRLDRTATDLALAENDRLPQLDILVEGRSSLSSGPYRDRENLELFIGGELRLPFQRRAALGKIEQATAELQRLQLEQRFQRERICNEVLDARSAVVAAQTQLASTERNVRLARELVAAEQRAFELGRSDLLRIQLREAQLADAETLAVDARLGLERARADHRAALGEMGAASGPH
ncbi:MAG: TolC family protein [Planctomycetes bacterium]|nr:TolC family protein [Planctomycetota bacterium]